MTETSTTAFGSRTSMRDVRRILGFANIVMAIAVAFALIANIVDRIAQDALVASHYFHFFTVQVSILDIVVMTIGGLAAIRLPVDTVMYTAVRACTVAYGVVVGIVYNLLLTEFPPPDGYVPSFTFPNEMQHIWVPLFLVVDWFITPGRPKLGWRVVGLGSLYPVVWLIATAVRGMSGDGWFPYFFLNPARVGGFGVAGFLMGLTVLIVGALVGAIAVTRLHRRIGMGAKVLTP